MGRTSLIFVCYSPSCARAGVSLYNSGLESRGTPDSFKLTQKFGQNEQGPTCRNRNSNR